MFNGFAQESLNSIKGVITSDSKPLSGAGIVIKDKLTNVSSNKDGVYHISASPKDILVYRYPGMKSIEIVVEDITSELNINMISETLQLDEVVVKKKGRRTQREKLLEYEKNTDLIKTAYGVLDKSTSGTSLNIIDESDFLPGAITFVDAIQGKFNGRVTYPARSRFYGLVIYLRERPNLSSGPQPAIYDLDGVITSDADAVLSIPVSEIKRIAILRGLSAASRYGPKANGGVIVVNTKTGGIKPKIDAIEVKDLQAAHSEFIAENLCKPSIEIPKSNELKSLFTAQTESQAIEIYDQEKGFFENSPFILIDAGNYFSQRWKNKEKAKQIWNTIKVSHSSNPIVLKAVAYHFEQNGDLKEALDIYQRISALRPEYAQTYRDLANMHQRLKNPKQALNLYTQYVKKQNKNTNELTAKEISLIMNVEALNILRNNKMDITKELKNFELPFEYSSTRVVLEWNNGEAEFDIEMQHQDNSYMIWNHSFASDSERITKEKLFGYSSEQFFIDKEDTGKWLFNIKYLGNKSVEPSYLKSTVQYNYGTPAQKDVVKVIRLSESESCLRLRSI